MADELGLQIKREIRRIANTPHDEDLGFVLFEIGCNDSTDTTDIYKLFDCPTMFLFEPDNRAYEKAVQANHDNQLYTTINNFAISDEDSTDKTFYEANNTLSGSLKKPLDHLKVYPDVKFETEKKIKTVKLDTFWQYKTHVDVCFMDVQGAEDLVIKGGKEFFENKCRYLYTEFSNLELYENAPTIYRILELLGDSWELVKIMWQWQADGNALLVNKKLVKY